MPYQIRPLQAHEVEQWRNVRLRALQDAPQAFGSRYEEVVQWSPERWQERTASLTAGGDQIMFLAERDDGHIAGCAGGVTNPDGVPLVISMWVEPESRGLGLARRLLDAVAAWARQRRASRLLLHVTRGNAPATRLYLACGFRTTGVTETNERGLIEEEMALML